MHYRAAGRFGHLRNCPAAVDYGGVEAELQTLDVSTAVCSRTLIHLHARLGVVACECCGGLGQTLGLSPDAL